MEKVQRSAAGLRKRKMLTVLPLLIVPFLTMGFWAMGGGRGAGPAVTKQQGLNMNLPDANLKEDKPSGKLSFYDMAAKDSAKLAEEIKNDPYYQREKEELFPASPLNMIAEQTASKYNQSLNTSPYHFSQKRPEEEIMRKVTLLQEELDRSQSDRPQYVDVQKTNMDQPSSSFPHEVDRLQNMMQAMNSSDTSDPQMNQMSEMLNQILDIQHPERMTERIKEQSSKNKGKAYPVCKLPASAGISLFNGPADEDRAGFYGIDDDKAPAEHNAIEAVIHQDQELVNGAVIKLRLLDDIYIAGDCIPKESFVYGTCSLNGERLEVEVNSIRCNNSLYPVKLGVYDMDGLPGIYIPGAITRDAAKQSADNSLRLMEMNTFDPSLKAQATATGINAVKNLLSKKAKLGKVTVKAGYKVLLKQSSSM